MKFYRVFEIEGYKFTWAGGSILNIYYPDKETTPGRLQAKVLSTPTIPMISILPSKN